MARVRKHRMPQHVRKLRRAQAAKAQMRARGSHLPEGQYVRSRMCRVLSGDADPLGQPRLSSRSRRAKQGHAVPTYDPGYEPAIEERVYPAAKKRVKRGNKLVVATLAPRVVPRPMVSTTVEGGLARLVNKRQVVLDQKIFDHYDVIHTGG